jgi:hypothetical protein
LESGQLFFEERKRGKEKKRKRGKEEKRKRGKVREKDFRDGLRSNI